MARSLSSRGWWGLCGAVRLGGVEGEWLARSPHADGCSAAALGLPGGSVDAGLAALDFAFTPNRTAPLRSGWLRCAVRLWVVVGSRVVAWWVRGALPEQAGAGARGCLGAGAGARGPGGRSSIRDRQPVGSGGPGRAGAPYPCGMPSGRLRPPGHAPLEPPVVWVGATVVARPQAGGG